jgi:ankyrin repeat protein
VRLGTCRSYQSLGHFGDRITRATARRSPLLSCVEPVGGLWEFNSRTTPLDLAVATGDVQVVEALLHLGADAHHSINLGAIYRAVQMKRTDLMRLLLAMGADPMSHSGVPLLREALKTNDPEVLKVLFAFGADPNARWWSPYAPV